VCYTFSSMGSPVVIDERHLGQASLCFRHSAMHPAQNTHMQGLASTPPFEPRMSVQMIQSSLRVVWGIG
jgi:hypothetical protein